MYCKSHSYISLSLVLSKANLEIVMMMWFFMGVVTVMDKKNTVFVKDILVILNQILHFEVLVSYINKSFFVEFIQIGGHSKEMGI